MGAAMTNRPAKESGGRRRCAFKLNPLSYLVAMLLVHLAVASASSQQTHVVLNDAKALVTQIDISPGGTYKLPEAQGGDVWTALDPVILLTKKGGQQSQKRVRAGDAATVETGEQIEFRAGRGLPAHLVVVKPKMTQQELTVGPFVLSGSLEDASDRNATLLVAISNCRFRDTWNLGDESEWTPSKPDIVVMKAGSVRWIRPGIHHFKNLGSSAARMVSIEW